MNKKLRCVIILVGLTFFNGCVGQQPIKYFVESNVTSFHNIKGKVENTVRVLPFDQSLGSSLQFQNYATTIVSFLREYGFNIAGENQEPDYIVFVSYGIGSGQTISESKPIVGQTGGGFTTHSGSVYGYGGGASYYGSSYTMPTFGVVGSRTSTTTQYTRNLALDIVNASSLKSNNPQKIYEGRVKSVGTCGVVNIVMNEMIQSLFKNFPGTNGASRKVIIPINKPDC